MDSLLHQAMVVTDNHAGGTLFMSSETKNNLWGELQPRVYYSPGVDGWKQGKSYFNGYVVEIDDSIPENQFRVVEALT